MDKLFSVLLGALLVGFAFYGVFSGEMPGIGSAQSSSSRVVTFETDPIEYCIQLGLAFVFGVTLIKATLFEKTNNKKKKKNKLQASDFEDYAEFVKLKQIESSIRNPAFIGAIIGFLSSFLIAYLSSSWLNIEPDTCVKCQENGDILAFVFFSSIPLLSLLGYYIPLKFKVWRLLKNKVVTKLELKKMNLYGSLTHHKL